MLERKGSARIWMSQLILLLLFTVFYTRGQELPPISHFSSDVYQAGNQNWSIAQSDIDFIYIANNDGLLEYNGAYWSLYPSPNNSIVRAVAAIDGKVYTGNYMDFGVWERNEYSQLVYRSLLDELKLDAIEDEQFWSIIQKDKWILFQSFNRIIIYDTLLGNAKAIMAENSISKVFEAKDVIYFHDNKYGIYSILNGEKQLVNDDPILRDEIIIGIFELNGKLLLFTQTSGILVLDGDHLTTWDVGINETLRTFSLYSVIRLSDGGFAIGTISNGLLILDANGNTKYRIDEKNGLGDNTVLSVWEDKSRNIWLGLNNGIDCINLDSRFTFYSDPEGKLGTAYSSAIFNGRQYMGTNQGLFSRMIDRDEDYELIPGTEGQVWMLGVINDELFAGHHLGTFIIEDDSARLVADVEGTWDIKQIPGNDSLLLQGNYSGLHILENNNGVWKLRNKIAGFDISSKHFELASSGRIIVSHEYKGVFVINVTPDYREITDFSRNSSVDRSSNSSLVAFNDQILYGAEFGIFKYEYESNTFIKDTILSKVFENDVYVTGKMVVDDVGQLWIFTRKQLNKVQLGSLANEYVIEEIPISISYRTNLKGYENIYHQGDDRYLLGTAHGYLMLDNKKEADFDTGIVVTEVRMGGEDGRMNPVDMTEEAKFDSENNFVQISYAIPEFNKYLEAEYQYILKGRREAHWSGWTQEFSQRFENLDYGTYSFEVRGRIGNYELDNVAVYEFEIKKPWYASTQAIIIYILLGLIAAIIINYFYKLYYRRQQQKVMDETNREMKLKELASEQEIMRLNNESLNRDIESRNRELAVATMNMVKNNNVLQSIKNEILKNDGDVKSQSVIKIIDNSLNSKEDWKFFEEAFNHADKDFFKKVKSRHPDLTSNDLRLCVYLRLNLTSKEIAPLLNISPRSVEIKRYRLRKKINLEREINLNEYFINL